MKPIQDSYPFFEANQVLTSFHLNQIFDYLDEQERLTRANLIGIGIECGLEIRSETIGSEKVIRLTRGCGVGSAGYLLVEPVDVTLISYKNYTLPGEVNYPQFKYESGGKSFQYTMWELFPAGEPNSILLGKDPTFLDDKAVILFLELKKEGLRNCSANNCDDKGGMVTATVRKWGGASLGSLRDPNPQKGTRGPGYPPGGPPGGGPRVKKIPALGGSGA